MEPSSPLPVMGAARPATQDLPRVRLRVLATSDLHAHVLPWDYYTDTPVSGRGLAQLGALIAAARAEVPGSVLLDNGDFLQGSPMGDMLAETWARGPQGPHPVIAAMNALGYDAATIGNHEFSHGIDYLLATLAEARFPVVSSNIATALGAGVLDDAPFIATSSLLTRTLRDGTGRDWPLTIGILGFAPPQTLHWDRPHTEGRIVMRDIIEAARAHVPALRARGADVVVALSHSGIGPLDQHPGLENVSTALAALPGIDALVTGHTHKVFPGPDHPAVPGVNATKGMLSGKPAVMPGFFGSHLGVIDLDLERRGEVWAVRAARAECRPVARRDRAGRLRARHAALPAIEAIAKPAHRTTRRWIGRRIAETEIALHSYFSLVSDCPTVRLVAQAQAAHVRYALQGQSEAALPLLSAAAPFRAGGRGGPDNYTVIPPGPVALRNIADLYIHPNTITALRITGAELVKWLERSASLFHRIAPGSQDVPLIDPEHPSFNFDQITGVTYQVDLAQPPMFDMRGDVVNAGARRIRDLCLQGRPVQPDQIFILATNSYRAGGGAGFAGAEPGRVVYAGRQSNRDILMAHVAGLGHIPDTGPPGWAFRPYPGTTALFDSAPDAASHLPGPPGPRIDALDLQPSGFRAFRLHL